MTEAVIWSWSVRAESGPTVGQSGSSDVDAYQKVSVTIPGSTTQDVTVGPGKWDSVSALFVSASDMSGKLTVAPSGGTSAPLDGPLVLIGSGPVSLLGTGVATLTFHNTVADPIDVDLFVTRDATP